MLQTLLKVCKTYITNILTSIPQFYNGPEYLGPYWDPRRKLIETRYETIDFPYTPHIERTSVTYSELKPIASYCMYLDTWSAVQKYNAAHSNAETKSDIVAQMKQEFKQVLNTSDDGFEIKVIWDMPIVFTVKK